MKHNVYDFDKTIYKRDSSLDFYLFCMKKQPGILAEIPVLMIWSILFLFQYRSNAAFKTVFKEKFYRFLRYLDSVDELVEEFWKLNRDKIADFYQKNHRNDDIVISASPEFLLLPICSELGIGKLIASRVDKHTGRYTGENCWGEEKVRRFREDLGEALIGEFYSDSLSDAPLAEIAEKAYLVRRNDIIPWPW